MIGVFDSGYGGLSVFAALSKAFPDIDLVYLGDNGRAPYGSRSPEVIAQYTKEALHWFSNRGAPLVVLACNTASSQALPRLVNFRFPGRRKFSIIGVVEPVVEVVKRKSRQGPVAVIATKATVRSGIYTKELEDSFRVIEKACPLLVPLVEEGITSGPVAERILEDYLSPLKAEGVTTLVLGCTHYCFLKDVIRKIMPEVDIIDASSVISNYLRAFLANNLRLSKRLSRRGLRTLFTTDEKDDFARFVERHLKLSIEPTRVSL